MCLFSVDVLNAIHTHIYIHIYATYIFFYPNYSSSTTDFYCSPRCSYLFPFNFYFLLFRSSFGFTTPSFVEERVREAKKFSAIVRSSVFYFILFYFFFRRSRTKTLFSLFLLILILGALLFFFSLVINYHINEGNVNVLKDTFRS